SSGARLASTASMRARSGSGSTATRTGSAVGRERLWTVPSIRAAPSRSTAATRGSTAQCELSACIWNSSRRTGPSAPRLRAPVAPAAPPPGPPGRSAPGPPHAAGPGGAAARHEPAPPGPAPAPSSGRPAAPTARPSGAAPHPDSTRPRSGPAARHGPPPPPRSTPPSPPGPTSAQGPRQPAVYPSERRLACRTPEPSVAWLVIRRVVSRFPKHKRHPGVKPSGAGDRGGQGRPIGASGPGVALGGRLLLHQGVHLLGQLRELAGQGL